MAESSFDHYQNPPDYSTIVPSDLTINTDIHNISEPSQNSNNDSDNSSNGGMGPRVLFNSDTYRHQSNHSRRHTTTNFPCQKALEKIDSFSSTMPRRQTTGPPNLSIERSNFRNLTAHDVAQLLRSTRNAQQLDGSFAPSIFVVESNSLTNSISESGPDPEQEQEDFSLTRSVEELVLNEIPVGESNAAATFCDKD